MVHGEEKMKISDEVIAVCAVNATLKTEGVARLAGGFSNTLSKNLLGKELMSKGVKVNQSDEGVQIDVHIIVTCSCLGYSGKRQEGSPVHDRTSCNCSKYTCTRR